MKTSTFAFLTLFFIYTFQLSAQSVVFEKSFPGPGVEVGRTVAEAPDSSLIIISSTTTNTQGLADIVITKMTPSGQEIWSVMNGGFNNDIANSGIVLDDGSTVAVGFTGSFTSSPSRDLYLIKVDAQGNITWTRSHGGTSHDEGMDIKQTADGGFIVVGFTESYGAGGEDFWLLKLDSLGNKMWDATFGGTGQDNARSVGIAADGGYILAGAGSGPSGGDQDLWLVKTDSNGTEEWNQGFGSPTNLDWAWDIAVAADGYVAVGTHNYAQGTSAQFTGKTFFLKVDLQGNLLWDESIITPMGSQLISVHPGKGGNWFLSGIQWNTGLQSDFWILKADDKGQMIWEAKLGTATQANMAVDVIQTINGDVVATGFSGLAPNTSENLHIVRLSDNSIGIEEEFAVSKNQSMSVSPNPTDGMLNVHLPAEDITGSIAVYNAMGKELFRKPLYKENSIELDLSGLPSGMYFLNLRSGEIYEVSRSGCALII